MNSNPLRLDGDVERGRSVQITVDGEVVDSFEGETIAVALMASGRRAFRHPEPGGHPRGVFCGMGICYDCTVTVVGLNHVRACVTPVRDGMQVITVGQ